MLAPTLIVGLGGTGSDIVQRVEKKVTKSQRKRLSFVAFDTDANELKALEKENPFVTTVQTSTRMTVGEYLDIDDHARETWFPVNHLLARKTLTEGAGQVRAISRLALDTAIRAGMMEKLHQAIESLYKLEGEEAAQALRVIIVSSLAGGTGSGLILPVAMYIKHYLKSHFQQNANITRGFFILPEVFYSAVKDPSERNNLRCNAYATLRELDAFLMKGDTSLPKKYWDKLKLEFPSTDSEEYEEYDVMPYDFCFLFDAQNIDGSKLNSFEQYKEHAANCIYAQSIGPMNRRSNSSEDNTIRDICRNGGRNRYAGAGSSVLLYPFEDIKEFIALRWAKECVSDQWLLFDRMYKEKSIENNEMRSRGYNVSDLDPAKDYIVSVETAAKQEVAFPSYIVNVCSAADQDDMLTDDQWNWNRYLKNLLEYVEQAGVSGQQALDAQKSDIDSALRNLDEGGTGSWEPFVTAYDQMARYKKAVFRITRENARTIAYTLFKANLTDVTVEKKPYSLETYMRNSRGEFIHPNAIRYFLYQTLQLMEQQKAQIEKDEVDESKEYLDRFESVVFNDPSTENEEETYNDLGRRKVPLINRLTRKPTGDQQEMIGNYRKFMTNVEIYRVSAVKAEVLEEGISYVKNLCDVFQAFYGTFENHLNAVDRKAANIATRYQDRQGLTTRYVCASEKCFYEFAKEMPFTGGTTELPGELCASIYRGVRDYAMLSENKRPKPADYFEATFQNVILEYFRNAVIARHKAEIEMDVLQALEKEAQFEAGIFDADRVKAYVEDVIDEVKHLSEPFIEKPLGEQRGVITACAYNSELDDPTDPTRHNLISVNLADAGGCADDNIEKNMILFYKSIYGLRANDLSKFAPPSTGVLNPRNAGEYYKAYFELINQITPKTEESLVITPHIDKNWHLISYLPDLDDDNQRRQERDIYKAFFYGLVFDQIQYKTISGSKKWYRLLLSGSDTEDFVVSNGTNCDVFYEVLDALTINPVIVERLIETTENIFEKEHLSTGQLTVENCRMKKKLSEFRLTQYSDRIMSIFDIPMMVRVTTPSANFDDRSGKEVMRVFYEVIYDYLKGFCPESELNYRYADFIMEQYLVYKENLSWYLENYADAIGSFADSLLETAIQCFSDLDLEGYSDKVLEDYKQLETKRSQSGGYTLRYM